MRLVLLALLLPLPALAQSADSVQSWFNPAVAFTWPQPFNHIPQAFEAQAVRFSAPPSHNLAYAEVYAHTSTRSPDGFNDTLIVSVHTSTADGYPGEVLYAERYELAELVPGAFTQLPLVGPRFRGDFWLSLDLRPAGQPDTLVLVSGGATDPPLQRAAAFVRGEGWRLHTETQFGKEYNYHIRAGFKGDISAIGAQTDTPGFGILPPAPQPASGRARVEVEGVRGPGTLEVFDVLGRRVQVAPLASSQTLDVSTLPAGTYLLRASTRHSSSTRTLVVR
jgi:hypothetical protein